MNTSLVIMRISWKNINEVVLYLTKLLRGEIEHMNYNHCRVLCQCGASCLRLYIQTSSKAD